MRISETGICIRAAIPSDASSWEQLRCALWPDDAAEHAAETASFFAGTLVEPVAMLMAETDNGTSIGVAELSIRTDISELTGQRVGYVEGLYIIPKMRWRGVARLLMRASRDCARDQNCTAFASDRAGRIVIDRTY
jgi:aminoglycoside 6'-N-acetyltransferase I